MSVLHKLEPTIAYTGVLQCNSISGAGDIAGMMSSDRQDWATPPDFIRKVEKKIGRKFDLDVCAYDHTAKAPKWFTEKDDALTKEWSAPLCWMNPPYGRALPIWLKYAYDQSQKHNNTIICLVPARTDTAWFHDIATKGTIVLLRGRINFEQEGEKAGSPAFPSMIVVFNDKSGFNTWEWKNEVDKYGN